MPLSPPRLQASENDASSTPGDDGDADGTADCHDACPLDAAKIAPGRCGCGAPDSDSDRDGDATIDCLDECPDDPAKAVEGECGCGIGDHDADGNGVVDCLDTLGRSRLERSSRWWCADRANVAFAC